MKSTVSVGYILKINKVNVSFYILFNLTTRAQKRQNVNFNSVLKGSEASAHYTTLGNSNFVLTNPIMRGSLCFGV